LLPWVHVLGYADDPRCLQWFVANVLLTYGDRVKYDDKFFDYVDAGAVRSAQAVVAHMYPLLRPKCVLDVGCGRGGWLKVWQAAGCELVQGVDGDYVDRTRLYIDRAAFQPTDLATPFDLHRRFDLVQCLEVAEHIVPERAEVLVDSIVRHGDVVLFSAAVPGQGGTRHVNERPLDYWRGLFATRGYAAFDMLRPSLHTDASIEPWYRFNSIVYANTSGQATLLEETSDSRVPDNVALADFGSWSWRLRTAVLRHLPVGVIDQVAVVNAKVHRLLRSSP
jgi:SAM-dependent methyltransferase